MTEVLSYEALKADRDAQQKRADALAVENQALRDFIKQKCFVVPAGASCLAEADEPAAESIPETPATDAALAAIEARGVDKFAAWSSEQESMASGAGDKKEARIYCQVAARAKHFAIRLREAK